MAPHNPRPAPVCDIYVRTHTLDRFREHHPDATLRSLQSELARAQEVEPGFIAPFLGRTLQAVRDRYLVAPDRRGVFVVGPNRNPDSAFPGVLITYLRFGAYQEEVMRRLLPG